MAFDTVDEALEAMCCWFNSIRPTRCFYCGLRLTVRREHIGTPNYRTDDHVIPLCEGGWLTVYACTPCNNAKGNMSLNEFRFMRYSGKWVEFFGETEHRRMLEGKRD